VLRQPRDLLEEGSRKYPDLVQAVCGHVGYTEWEGDAGGMSGAQACAVENALLDAGTDTFAAIFGNRSTYADVALQAAQKLGAEVPADATEVQIETAIVKKLHTDITDAMSSDERRRYLASIDASNFNPGNAIWGRDITIRIATATATTLSVQLLALAVRGIVGRGLLAFLGPLGWVVSGAWLAAGMTGPAYRKTVPAVATLAALRMLMSEEPQTTDKT
jgi:uncharacterized protein YaaW (UPF0174 family)